MKKIILIVAVAILTLGATFALAGCGDKKTADTQATQESSSQTDTQDQAQTNSLPTVDKLKVEDIKVGSGPKAETGNKLSVVYKGTLMDGTPFDSNTKDSPFEFTLGTSEVIPGWDEGLQGMQAGGVRKLTIPASMAYGDQAVGTIPAGSTLVFEVELLAIN